MLTSIKRAGLVLKTTPIIIRTLGSYSARLVSTRGGRCYASILNRYKGNLIVEEAKFRDTWQHIITPINFQPGITVDKLLQCPQALPGLQLETILLLALTKVEVESFEMALKEIWDLLEAVAMDFLEFSDASSNTDLVSS